VRLTELLVEWDLARPSEDGVSVPLHPVVRRTVLVLLSQLARDAGHRSGLELHPATPNRQVIADLIETLAWAPMPSSGHVVALNLEVVSLNLASVPLDEILDFRQQHGADYRAYARNVRQLLAELALLAPNERRQQLVDRRHELADAAESLRRTARRAWRIPLATFSLGAAGAVWAIGGQADPVAAAVSLATGALGLLHGSPAAGAYSCIFDAEHRLGSRSGFV
jgi:hypothetical protein